MMEKLRSTGRIWKQHLLVDRKNELLLIGDHIAHMGKTLGAFGLEHGTSAEEKMLAWAQQCDLYIVDTYFQKNTRGTWCLPQSGKWYELGYIFAKQDQRMVIKNIRMDSAG